MDDSCFKFIGFPIISNVNCVMSLLVSVCHFAAMYRLQPYYPATVIVYQQRAAAARRQKHTEHH